jgi:hypothetical protein
MLRVVFAVVLAVAITAAATPAIEQARTARTQSLVRSQISALDTTIDRLVAFENAVARGTPGARQLVTIRLPTGSAGTKRLQEVRIRSLQNETPTNPAAVSWTISGTDTSFRRLVGTEHEVPIRTSDGSSIVFREPKRHRLAVRLVRERGTRSIRVGRAGPSPEVYPGRKDQLSS